MPIAPAVEELADTISNELVLEESVVEPLVEEPIVAEIPTSDQVRLLESTVKLNQNKAIETMEQKHDKKRNKRTITFTVGEPVSVFIPPIDRVGCDFSRLPAVILELKPAGDLYSLVTKYGILDICYRAGDLESYCGDIGFDYKKITNKISLRSAAQAFNQRSKDKSETSVSCQCNGKCKDNRCNCFKRDKKCNTHCHLKSVANICCNQ